jgi:hypothetical protein
MDAALHLKKRANEPNSPGIVCMDVTPDHEKARERTQLGRNRMHGWNFASPRERANEASAPTRAWMNWRVGGKSRERSQPFNLCMDELAGRWQNARTKPTL